MTRDYPEMLWSSYNFWCHYDYDGITCEYGHWVIPGVHRRSPQLFHEMIQGDVNGTKVRDGSRKWTSFKLWIIFVCSFPPICMYDLIVWCCLCSIKYGCVSSMLCTCTVLLKCTRLMPLMHSRCWIETSVFPPNFVRMYALDRNDLTLLLISPTKNLSFSLNALLRYLIRCMVLWSGHASQHAHTSPTIWLMSYGIAYRGIQH
jgi:hypothetical protein